MNIFVLDRDPKLAAQYHCDVHLNKMLLEYAQLLSTAMWYRGGIGPYKATHANHPCAVWARHSTSNYQWLCDLFSYCQIEYITRKNKHHATNAHVKTFYEFAWENPHHTELTKFPLAMPDCFKVSEEPPESFIDDYWLKYKKSFNSELLSDGQFDDMPYFVWSTEERAVQSYRNYYNHKHLMFKRNKVTWTNRSEPWWYVPSDSLPPELVLEK